MSGNVPIGSSVSRLEPLERIGSPLATASAGRKLAARLEPFDSYWQAPEDVDSGYRSFNAYYRANYLPYVPQDRASRILVVSCGPGYLVEVLKQQGYTQVSGIDSDAVKVAHAKR